MSVSDLPLAVDMDGTLIFDNLSTDTWLRFIRTHPLHSGAIITWWLKGRAYMKQQIAKLAPIDCTQLIFNQPFTDFLRAEYKMGRELVLATGSDLIYANQVAEHLDIFTRVFASDGKINLVGSAKAKVLDDYFGPGQYAYAGNSHADLAVWRRAGEAVAVNTRPSVLRRLRRIKEPKLIF